MMRIMFRKILALCSASALWLAALSLGGCGATSYSRTSFEILRPAYYTFPKQLDTLLIVNCQEPQVFTDTSLYAPDFKLAAKVAEYERDMPSLFASVLCAKIIKSNYLPCRLIPNRLTADDLARLIRDNAQTKPNTGILVVKSFSYKESVQVTECAADETGGGLLLASLFSVVETRLAFVAPDGQIHNLLPRTDTLEWTHSGATSAEIAAQMPRYYDKLRQTADNAADVYAHLLIPEWQRVNRPIFANPNPLMMQASRLAEDGDYGRAEAVWAELAQSGKAREKAVAAINIMLARERADDAQTAAIWCSKAMDLLQDKKCAKMQSERNFCDRMFPILLERIEEKKALDRQM